MTRRVAGAGAWSSFGGLGDGSGSRVDLARQLAVAPGNPEALNRLSALAARLLHTASSHVSLISNVQTVMGGVGSSTSAVGLDSSLEDSVCAVTVVSRRSLEGRGRDDRSARSRPGVGAGRRRWVLPRCSTGRARAAGRCAVRVRPGAAARGATRTVVLLEQLAAPVLAELQLAVLAAEYEDERLVVAAGSRRGGGRGVRLEPAHRRAAVGRTAAASVRAEPGDVRRHDRRVQRRGPPRRPRPGRRSAAGSDRDLRSVRGGVPHRPA